MEAEHKTRPILFNGEMVRAILDGRKTQTRRPVKPKPDCVWDYPQSIGSDGGAMIRWGNHVISTQPPLGMPGDRLYVRETWAEGFTYAGEYACVFFRANKTCRIKDSSTSTVFTNQPTAPNENMKWKPSIHMPKWASRITLEITAVRVERVQEISDDDARAEGATIASEGDCFQDAFRRLYESIYGTGNDWVWVYEFRVVN